jgi:hypothetical protein
MHASVESKALPSAYTYGVCSVLERGLTLSCEAEGLCRDSESLFGRAVHTGPDNIAADRARMSAVTPWDGSGVMRLSHAFFN